MLITKEVLLYLKVKDKTDNTKLKDVTKSKSLTLNLKRRLLLPPLPLLSNLFNNLLNLLKLLLFPNLKILRTRIKNKRSKSSVLLWFPRSLLNSLKLTNLKPIRLQVCSLISKFTVSKKSLACSTILMNLKKISPPLWTLSKKPLLSDQTDF